MVLAHTIEAIAKDKPARVHCNTCRSQHGYRPEAPREGGSRARTRVGSYASLVAKNAGATKRYSPADKYETGDVLDHPTFGVGAVVAVKDTTKIEVLFNGGVRMLVHGR
jgi:hypothetical protein